MSNKLLANGGRMNWEWSDEPDVSEQHEPGYVCEWATFAGAASEAAPGWTDLLAQASLTPQTTLGEWTRNAQDSLTGLNTENGGRGGAPQIVFSDRPTGSYELETGIVFHSSRRAMLHFPAGNGMASLCYHFADGGVIWLDTDGVNDPTNLPPESTLSPFRMDEEFVGRIRVDVDGDQVQIAISVNGTDLPVYRGPSASLQAAVPRLPVPMLDRLTEQFAVMIGADSTTGATLTRFRYQPITSQSAPEREWTDLFNGSDLTGWKQVGDGGWTVQNGILTSQPGNGWIATEQEFDDFELQLEFRLSAGANSGVFLRFPDQGALSGGDFLEVQLIDDSKQPNAPAWQQTGAIYAVQGPTPPPNPAVGQWHQLTIHALGPEIVVSIDGREVNRVNLETAPVVGPPKRDLKRSRGHIGLQHRQPAEFRNIRIRELDPAAVDAPQAGAWSDLFNGRDLAGWRGRADLWRWDKGELVGSTAPNGLERFNSCLCSDRSYRDFEIEFEAKLQGTNPNSGLQIRSGTIDADNFVMAGPQVDIGGRLWGGLYGEQTGGIMQAADEAAVNRIIQPDDWHSVTVRCVGRHVTITVNGTITVDDEFPTIAAEGILGWQLHRGEAMTARFRNIRIRELSSEVTGAPSAPARPDDPIAPAQIPDDAVPFSGHAYKFFPEQLSWTEARTRCEALGGRLVIIDSAAENEFVARLIEAGGKVDAWIGITDEFEEGNWVSVDGQPLKFTNWIQGQPNNKQPGEHYGLVSNKILADGQRVGWEWSDQPNDSAQFAPGYICEWSEPANAAVNVPADGWFDLLAEVTPDAQNSRGTWTRTGAGYLAGDRKRSWLFPELSFSQRPAGSYELEVGLVFGEADHVILGLPAGSGMANLILIRSNEGSVVWQTGGEFSPATQPPDQRLKYALHPNTGYLLRVSVEVQPDGSRVRLSGAINGQSLPALSRDPADLTYVSPPRGLNLTPLSSLAANFGIHVGQGSTATLTRFRYR